MWDRAKPYKDQDYERLRKDCLSSGTVFEDPEFPAAPESLACSEEGAADGIEWKRPGELVSSPRLITKGVDANDLAQGELGNCWFVAACACIAAKEKLWQRVMVEHKAQEWTGGKYAGIFHFRFWRYGDWWDVVIDDRLPARDGCLLYVHSTDPNEFWPALLEKAYAKLFGSYGNLDGGKAREALVDMTGGVGEGASLAEQQEPEKQEALFYHLESCTENHSLVSAAISCSKEELESQQDNGLVKGHAYSITAIKDAKLGSGLVAFFKCERAKLVRLRNPWGQKEWTGAWSDGSEEWKAVNDGEKEEMGLTVENNGEFWMSWEDFMKNFTSLDACHIVNTSVFSLEKTWKECQIVGAWSKPDRAGGCKNHTSFLNNPQYLFDIEDDEDELMVSLQQEDKREGKDKGVTNFAIGFYIIKTDINRKYRIHDVLEEIPLDSSFVNSRDIFSRVKLKKGRYCLVPTTFDPGLEGSFMLRVYASKDPELRIVEKDAPDPPGCCGAKVKAVTSVWVMNAQGLEKQDISGGADPFCIIKCEDEEVRLPTIKDTLNPEWKQRAVFYRRKPTSDIYVEVWNENVIKDEHMGTALVMMASNTQKDGVVRPCNMIGEGKYANAMRPGRLYVGIKHDTDPMDF